MLKPLQESDLKLILPWRNAPVVRNAMFNQHEISWEEHQAWYQRMRVDDSKQWLLYSNQNNEPNGVVYFTDIDDVQRTAFWGFYANPGATPGTGLRMSLDALEIAFNEIGLKKLNADVLMTNSRSLDMHKNVGFIQEGCFREQFFNGEKRVDIVRLGMLVKEWPKSRKALEARISELDDTVTRRQSTPPNIQHSDS